MATARAGGEAEQPLPLRVATTLGEGVGGARGGAGAQTRPRRWRHSRGAGSQRAAGNRSPVVC